MLDPFLRALPKIQLHCHLEGTLRETTFVELAKKAGVDLGPTPYAFEDFAGFLRVFCDVARVLRAPEDFERLAFEFALDASDQGVRYAEIFFSPSVWSFFNPGIDLDACLRSIRRGLDAAREERGIECALLCDVTRNLGPDGALATTRSAIEWQSLGVIGIGLGGDEEKFPARLFGEAFALARREGLHTVAHAGEADGAHSVRDAIEVLHAERIGHGVRAIDDPAVIALLVDRGIPLEICPTSNFRTANVATSSEHPLIALDRAGVRIAIDSDDPAIFGSSVLEEYELVERWIGRERTVRIARTAIEVSFASAARKAQLLAQFDAAVLART